MMRGYCFNYAGKNSLDFKLVFCYVGKSPDSLVAGGEYELSTDTLPYLSEQLLYGKKYEKTLEFEVEIINPDGNIEFENFRRIKNWLFGQDGWKKLKINANKYRDYFLRCLFIPKENIIDASGFRGVRCTLVNNSPYWYANPVKIKKDISKLRADENSKHNRWFDININSDGEDIILPVIRLKAKDGVPYDDIEFQTEEYKAINDTQKRFVSTSYLYSKPNSHSGEVFNLDTKFIQGYFNKTLTGEIIGENEITKDYVKLIPNNNKPSLYFKKGSNILEIQLLGEYKSSDMADILEWVEIEYEPKVDLGGF